MRTNFVDSMITEVDAKIKAAMAELPGKQITLSAYMENYRIPLNTVIVQALLGARLDKKKDKGNITDPSGVFKVKFRYDPPTHYQVMRICELLRGYINTIEAPLMAQFNAGAADDDMAIPTVSGGHITYEKGMTHRKLNSKMVNTNETFARCLLDTDDVQVIAAMGEDAFAKAALQQGLIIGGIVVVVAAGAVTAAILYDRHQKKKDAELYDTSVDGGNIPVLPETDIPVIPETDIPVLPETDLPVVNLE